MYIMRKAFIIITVHSASIVNHFLFYVFSAVQGYGPIAPWSRTQVLVIVISNKCWDLVVRSWRTVADTSFIVIVYIVFRLA